MKILHINSYYSTSLFYKNLFDYQIKNGLNIDVFVPVSSTFKKKNFDYGKYTTINKDYNQHDRFIFHFKHQKICKDIQCKYDFKEYSLIHAHSLFSNGYIALRLKKKYGTPYIIAVRNTDVNVFFKRMINLRKLGLEILNEAEQIIFMSKSYKNQVMNKYVPKNIKEEIENKISIIPNGIDDFWFDNIGFVKQKPKAPILRLVQIGDINKNKNIETTVNVVDLLIEKGYKVRLDVVGKVKDKKIFNKIKSLDFVNFLGYKSKDELIRIFRENDIFILPSINETFGLVYAEAMSQGLPIIYTKGQGFDGQFIDGEVGFSVNCCNANDIAMKILEILKNYENISKNCLSRCLKYRWKIHTKDYEEIYKSILMQ
jgi:glycosyltransferase involved in cell wall biosynthesis